MESKGQHHCATISLVLGTPSPPTLVVKVTVQSPENGNSRDGETFSLVNVSKMVSRASLFLNQHFPLYGRCGDVSRSKG